MIAGIVAGLVALALTELVRRNAVRLRLVQIPNHRSSHTIPTPAGGGVAIAVVSTLAGLAAGFFGGTDLAVIAGFAAALAVVGYADDVLDISARWRFLIQFIVVVGLVWIVQPLAPAQPLFAWLAGAVLVVAGVWWINLYNFMDGIDGIAGSQAIAILGCALWLVHGGDPIEALWIAATIGAVAGFLWFNWPPARIFLGDVGSNYLAVAILGLALHTSAEGTVTPAAWAILPAVFVTDATLTLLRRMLTGQSWFSAHRSHAYQHLSRRWGHRPVTLLYLALTIAWCLPLALWTNADPTMAWLALPLAYAPLLVFVFVSKAGEA
ncbi:glycosyltransferase family 4 protein [Devosia sp.]|uniref:MraY family glycosyltransferase n=1 Tax=Devosia sp. TaxID=1871048 RepID=UPI002AFF9DDB|nr:glycosyltransferase family 4 protein [Devosia sp.]